ncbi:MAG: ABC transporter ATP-binding protein [Actinomycetota bacterium]
MSEETNAIEAVGLTKNYASNGAEVHALNGIHLAVSRGEFVAVLGPSACGKSTMLNLFGGLARPTSGSVLLDGADLSVLSDDELSDIRRYKVGFIFQLFNLVPIISVEDNLALPAAIAGGNRDTVTRRVDELLTAVGLADQRGRLPSQLSGGQQQRVAIARALMMEPAVLLADEPTGNLDSQTGSEVMALFQAFHEQGQTIVLVTHDAKVASMADRVLFMRDGQIVRETRLEEGGESVLAISRLVELDA